MRSELDNSSSNPDRVLNIDPWQSRILVHTSEYSNVVGKDSNSDTYIKWQDSNDLQDLERRLVELKIRGQIETI